MNKALLTLIIPTVAVVLILVLAGCQATRAGYESAPYKVVRAAGRFQVRDYPALTLVETPMAGGGNGANGGFGRLFRFITGGNESRQKISMTTPVFMSGSDSNRTMAFVMPVKLSPGQVPKPTDGTVKVQELPPGRFAVLRFRGSRNDRNESTALERLRAWMAVEGLRTDSPPVFGYFDPPWTPAFLRRNEVMLRTGAGSP